MTGIRTSPDSETIGDQTKPRTMIIVNEDWCKGCGICIAFCPKSVLIPHGPDGKPTAAEPSDCTHCLLCEIRCPDFAIRVRTEDHVEQ